MKMYSVKDGELECREVDADFFEKNTTLGGLLTSKEVELDRDNKKESPFLRFPHLTSNMMETEAANVSLINLNADSITTGTLKGSKTWLNSLTGTMQFTNPTASDELDQDDCGESIKVTAENSGNSAFYEMAEKFREGLKAGIDYGYTPSFSIVADQLEYRHEPLDAKLINKIVSGIDVNRDIDYRPVTLEDLNNVQIHGKICQELTETYEKKNADYGNSFEISLDKHGLIAAIVRMDDKMNRVINLYKADERMVEDESVRDTLMDLANYAIMSVMWLDTTNS